MAAGQLPRPGTKGGPCNARCQHRDCAQTRRMAAAACYLCLSPIGYDTPYFEEGYTAEGVQRVVHDLCLTTRVDLDRVKKRLGASLEQNANTIARCQFCEGRTYPADGRAASLEPSDLWNLVTGQNSSATHRITGCLTCWAEVSGVLTTTADMVSKGLTKVVSA